MSIVSKTESLYDVLENNLTVENIVKEKLLIDDIVRMCSFHPGYNNSQLEQARNLIISNINRQTKNYDEKVTSAWNYFDGTYAQCNFPKEKEQVVVALIPILKHFLDK